MLRLNRPRAGFAPDALRPLLAAATPPGAILALGAPDLGGGPYRVCPAVLAARPDADDAPDVPLWVGSRHLAIQAIRMGAFACVGRGRRLDIYALTRDGRALARDLSESASMLARRIRDLEAELKEVLATIDLGIELDIGAAAAALATGRVTGDMSMQTAVMLALREAAGGWVSADALRIVVDLAANGPGDRRRLPNAVHQLRKRGWMIERDHLRGYRLPTAVRGDPAAALALGRPAEPPTPPPDMRRACIHCGEEKWLGEFKWHSSYGRFLNACRSCVGARDRARSRSRRPAPGLRPSAPVVASSPLR